ncbi:Xaa-Pro dipeptidase [Idiomarina tyrosinivorans]|uniref:Xaa-Pro dipeptidase n=1 Tax=Idiomarina tyrosinivorans TaxID=1445662 RepID=A0A432ZT15_9GAMM|nr:Xaa-Pro dipeptidase [Idiomarina tyrosinivorans]RUO81039.1 Xaa-Pro dipeptidase [Idiomarina tyrosinivorans]
MNGAGHIFRHFADHIAQLQHRAELMFEREGMTFLAIHSGQLKKRFLDDMEYPYKVNPHFVPWCPDAQELPNSWVLLQQGQRPKLIVYQPQDYWHFTLPVGDCEWAHAVDIETIATPEAIEKFLPYDKHQGAYIGEHIEVAKALGFEQINPDPVLNFWHYHRLFKTDYEIDCLARANVLGVHGHRAAAAAFANEGSEFDCLLAFCEATKMNEADAPYKPIIGINEHAAILHYMRQSKQAPQNHRSLLVDAGVQVAGYASDISRTHSARENEFTELVVAVDQLTQALTEKLRPGLGFPELHQLAHEKMANLLFAFGFITTSPDEIMAKGLTRYFFPHGLGHPLGVQVHDVGATQLDERGTSVPAPEQHPHLRTTRNIEPRQVYTVEPGVYFIDLLLQRARDDGHGKLLNWERINQFKPYGGVRIEDNVVVYRERNRNLTREAEHYLDQQP